MVTIKLFSYLKNTDLHVASAYDAATRLLQIKTLKRLRRFMIWELNFDASEQEAMASLNQILERSYYFLNPNKEGHYIGHLPHPHTKNNETIFLIKVPDNALDKEELIKKIDQKVGVVIKRIRKSLVWEITVEAEAKDSKATEKKIWDDLVLLTSRERGLLINPIIEQAERVAPEEIYSPQ